MSKNMWSAFMLLLVGAARLRTGEYDPAKRAFYVRDFHARLGDASRTSQLDRGTDWSEKLNAYYYSIRDPLICDAHY